MVTRMTKIGNGCYKINNKIQFKKRPWVTVEGEELKKCIKFAHAMTIGGQGEHRPNRTGGIAVRNVEKQFINVLQGKIGEYGFYNYCTSQDMSSQRVVKGKGPLMMTEPDFDVFRKGKWDSGDFVVNDSIKISVKSTKSYGNLLLLEKEDWDPATGEYRQDSPPTKFDFIYLVRVNPNIEDLLKGKELNNLEAYVGLISEKKFEVEITGHITHQRFLEEVIMGDISINQNEFILGKKNQRTKVDTDNYYVQAGDLR